MLRYLIPAVAALGLIAVAAQTRSLDAEAAPGMATPAMGWFLTYEGDTAKLAYGLANSDQLALMLTCAPGDRSVVSFGDVRPDTGGASLASAGEIDPLTGGLVHEVRVSLDDSALTDLARNGRLGVRGDAGRFELRASNEERSRAAQFFAYCGTALA